ncbi:MAG: UDP-2,3-diacylglucosamine diphosphatase [Proteobacteria bacterium]|nr:UDP-2,3-diacylglucosamine diphosphatase [Pseudomonadota bacterium]|tara:strand:- start:4173 stop:4883 length:711 start_codon:yes stop_codon:yes gene_type:complete
MSVFFISDLHLEQNKPHLTKAFKNFIDSKVNLHDELFILGDFFEQWIGDDNEDDFIKSVKNILKDKTAKGLTVYFMHGNRDFLIGDKFCKEVGAILLDDPYIINLEEKKIMLMHGDSLCTDDEDYQNFRNLVRNKDWQEDFLSKDLKERKEVAKNLREISSLENQTKDENIMDVNQSEVHKIIENHSVDVLIHGHTHRPFIHDENGVPRMVLGDWGDFLWFIESSEGNLNLLKEKI